jgi:hypothetical protein
VSARDGAFCGTSGSGNDEPCLNGYIFSIPFWCLALVHGYSSGSAFYRIHDCNKARENLRPARLISRPGRSPPCGWEKGYRSNRRDLSY